MTGALKYDMRRGSSTIASMREHGDLGFGTPEFPGGDMVIVKDGAYNGVYPDRVVKLEETTRVPFGFITDFQAEDETALRGSGIEELTAQLDQRIREYYSGHNYFYMIRLCGSFRELQLRTSKRYVDDDMCGKSMYDFKTHPKLQGMMIGLWSPAFVTGLNQYAWHFHFISDDRIHVGHVIGCGDYDVKAAIQQMTQWLIDLSTDTEFASIGFTKDES